MDLLDKLKGSKPAPETSPFGSDNTDQKPSDKGNELTVKADSKGTFGGFEEEKPTDPQTQAIHQHIVRPKITPPKQEEFPIVVMSTEEYNKNVDLIQRERPLTLEEKKVKMKQTMELVEYTANNALNADDFWRPKGSTKKALTRSGCNKLAAIFGISTETLKIDVVKEINIKGEEDIVAYATVKAIRPDGSYVIITANRALSEYGSDKPGAKSPSEWVDIQTLKGTAETRASNRAIQNAIGFVPKDFMVATKEEFSSKGSFG